MTKIIYLCFLLGITCNQQNTQKQQSDFLISPIDCYNIKYGYTNKLIDNYEEALKSGLAEMVKPNNRTQKNSIQKTRCIYLK